jgi:8-oxo-dGTP pyrophosphatase MutT (NUDIX family)
MNAPVVSKPSATIVLVREDEDGPSVLLVRRRAGDAFGDSYAFPGGVVDHDESNAHVVCDGRSPDDANRVLGVDDGLDYYSAAIRELFEETGVLLARDDTGTWAASEPAGSPERLAIDNGELAWPEFLRRRGLCMAGDALHYFAFWETPKVQPKRWQTRFFIAALPPGQEARHDGREVTDSRWLRPSEGARLGESGELRMPFPTRRTLGELTSLGSTADAARWAASRRERGIVKIRPAMTVIDGRQQILVPGDPGYEEADARWQAS